MRKKNAISSMALWCLLTGFGLVTILGCATPQSPGKVQVSRGSAEEIREAQKVVERPETKAYKRTVAIGRFSNETLYGRGIFADRSSDPLGEQAADILATELLRSSRFIVFERPDIDLIGQEQALRGAGELVGVDALIIGSVTEFGRSADGKQGFLSSTKTQQARAKVNLRLVEVETGRIFFTADGSGVVKKETGEVAGFGGYSAYDRTLNDRAIAAAIVDVMDEIVTELESRPWRTFILEVDGPTVYLAGGQSQGIKEGDKLKVMRRGKTIKSRQTGLPIELPGVELGTVEVVSLFGSDEANEGSVARIVSGDIPDGDLADVFVVEEDSGDDS